MRIRTFNHHTIHPGHSGNSGGTHPCCELLYLEKGHACLEWMGERYVGTAPGLFVLTPNTPHRLVCQQSSVDFWYIELHVEDYDPFVSVEQAIKWNRIQQNMDCPSSGFSAILQTTEALFGSLCSKDRLGGYDEEIVLLDIQKIIRLILNCFRESGHSIFDATYLSTREQIEMLMRHMESSYAEPIDLTVLSRRVHLNPSYLVRVFKNLTGVTPMQYLSNLRLNAAMSYLTHTDKGIQQIAEETGFNSIHYFSRLFKMRYGVSPQKWRMEQYRIKEGVGK